jgi:hypothetical protein
MLKQAVSVFLIVQLALAALSFDAVESRSQQATPSPPVGASANQAAPKPDRQSASNQTGTEQDPFTVRIQQPAKTKTEADREQRERDDKVAGDRNTFVLNCLTVGVAFLTLIAIAVQAYFLWRAVKASESATRAAEESAKTAARQLRAYIRIEIEKRPIRLIVGQCIVIRHEATNDGNTPATVTGSRAHTEIARELPDEMPVDLIEDDKFTISPRATASGPSWDPELILTTSTIENINSGVERIFHVISLEYIDVFGQSHETRIGVCFDPKSGTFPLRAANTITLPKGLPRKRKITGRRHYREGPKSFSSVPLGSSPMATHNFSSSFPLERSKVRCIHRLPPRLPDASAHKARVARTSASFVSVRTRTLASRIAGSRWAIDSVVQRSACLAKARRAAVGSFTNKAWHAASNGRP